MSTTMSLLLLFFSFLMFTVNSKPLQTCEKGKILEYSYTSSVGAFGTKSQTLNFEAVVGIECLVSKYGKNFYIVSVPAIKLIQKVKGGAAPEVQWVHSKDFSAFVQEASGKVAHFLNKKLDPSSETAHDPMIFYNVRKQIVSFFSIKQNKANGKRIEETSDGVVVAHYTFTSKKKLVRMKKRTRSHEVIKANKGQKKKDTKFESTTSVLFKDGRVERVNFRYISIAAANEKGNEEYERDKKTFGKYFHKIKESDERARRLQEGTSVSRLIFINSFESKKKQINLTKVFSSHTTIHDAASTLGLVAEDLTMSETTQEYSRQLEKAKLKEKVNFPQLLEKLKQSYNPSSFTLALQFTKSFSKEAVEHLVAEYKKLNLQDKKDLQYSKVLHSLLANSQEEKAQEVLVDAIKTDETRESAVFSTVALQKPTDEIIHHVQAVSSDERFGKVLSNSAYLLFAHLASKTQNKLLSQKMLHYISLQMEKVNTADDFGYHVKALSNAGEAVPLSVLEHIPLDSKITAAQALQHRVNVDVERTTELIHEIVDSDFFHPHLKAAAIQSQIHREKVLENSASVSAFERHLNSPDTPENVIQAIKQYYKVEGSPRSLSILGAETEDWFDDIVDGAKKTFEDVKGWVVDAADDVSDFVKHASAVTWTWVETAFKDTEKAFVGLFDKAKEFLQTVAENVGARVDDALLECVTAAGKVQVCIHSPNIGGFLKEVAAKFDLNQGYERATVVKREVVDGIRILYSYDGLIMGTASKRPLGCSDQNVKFLAYQMNSVEIGALSLRLPIFSGNSYLAVDKKDITSPNAVQDRFRLTLLGLLNMWDLSLVPAPLKAFLTCDRMVLYMMEENLSFHEEQRQFLMGPVPIFLKASVGGSFKLIYSYALCEKEQIYSLNVEPEFSVGPVLSGGFGMKLFHSGIEGAAEIAVSQPGKMAHVKCNTCSKLDLSLKPFNFRISAYVQLLQQRITVDLYKFEVPALTINQGFECDDPTTKDEWDPDQGVKDFNIRIEKARMYKLEGIKNLAKNLLFAAARQRVWLEIVKRAMEVKVRVEYGAQYEEWLKAHHKASGQPMFSYVLQEIIGGATIGDLPSYTPKLDNINIMVPNLNLPGTQFYPFNPDESLLFRITSAGESGLYIAFCAGETENSVCHLLLLNNNPSTGAPSTTVGKSIIDEFLRPTYQRAFPAPTLTPAITITTQYWLKFHWPSISIEIGLGDTIGVGSIFKQRLQFDFKPVNVAFGKFGDQPITLFDVHQRAKNAPLVIENLMMKQLILLNSDQDAKFYRFDPKETLILTVYGQDIYINFCEKHGNPEPTSPRCYFLILNGWGNAKSWFGRGSVTQGRKNVHESAAGQYFDTPAIYGYQPYWIRFNSEFFQVGRGNVPGINHVLNAAYHKYAGETGNFVADVDSVSFSKYPTQQASLYNILQVPFYSPQSVLGHSITPTPQTQKQTFMTFDWKQTLYFDIVGYDAQFVFCDNGGAPTISNCYMFILNGWKNTQSWFGKANVDVNGAVNAAGLPYMHHNTGPITGLTKFWLRFAIDDKRFQAGWGEQPGKLIIMDSPITQFHFVDVVGFSKNPSENPQLYNVIQKPESVITHTFGNIITPTAQNQRQTFHRFDWNKPLHFVIKSYDAQFVFCDNAGAHTISNCYMLILNGWNNAQSWFGKANVDVNMAVNAAGAAYAHQNTGAIIGYKTYYMRFLHDSKRFQIGWGSEVGKLIIMESAIPNFHFVDAVAFSKNPTATEVTLYDVYQ